ncbi:MAG: SRPBCC domain-containing protein [Myxococcales bacterium]|nr:SRPBCC domain-containing protein [Myxococcales bacterium]
MQLRTEIEIAAPPQAVWDELIAFARYPEWNPFISSVSGRLELGERLTLVLSSAGGNDRKLVTTLTRIEPPATLRWTSKFLVRGLFDGEHYFELLPLAGDRTRLVHGEELTGALVQYMGPRLTAMARGFVGMNEALAKRLAHNAKPRVA